MAMRSNPGRAREKWVARLSAATADIQAGVDAVATAPGAAAVAKNEKRKLALAASEEKWKRNTAAVTREDWQASMKNVGIPRIAQGAQAKQAKYEKFASEFFPHLQRGSDAVSRMPDTTLEERLARMVAMARHNHGFKRGG